MLSRKSLLVILFLLTAVYPMLATTYYVSPNGCDFFFGTSPLFPWASIARVNQADLRAGDQVYFQRGGVWREMLVPQASGLYYGAYGSGARPVISGANLVSQSFFQANFAFWIVSGTNAWTLYLPGFTPTQVWFNGVAGSGLASNYAGTLGLNQWFYDGTNLHVYSTVNPGLPTAPAIEVTERYFAMQVSNVSSVTVEHLAFVNSASVNVLLGTGNSGQEIFNDVVVSGALKEGVSVGSGSPSISGSEVIGNGSGLNVYGGSGFTLSSSIVSGNDYQGINVTAVNGPSYVQSSTVTGNSTNSPGTPTVNSVSKYGLYASNSVLLPNPFEPKIYNFVGLTDNGNNVYQSPYFKARAAQAIVMPFIDDYINLGVAQAVAQVA